MARALKILGIVVAALGLLAVAAMALVQSEWAERRIVSIAADRIGRQVELGGLRIMAAWPPRVALDLLRVANPDWARERYLLDARGLRATFEPGPLLRGNFLAAAALDHAAVGLQRDGERNTWELALPEEQAGEARGRLVLRSFSIGELRVGYFDERDRTDVTLQMTGDIGREGRPFQARAEGRLRAEPLHATLEAPAVPLAGEQPVALALQVRVGENQASGKLALRAANRQLQSIEGRLELAAPSLAALGRLLRAEMPKSRPWRVAANLRHEEGRWDLNDIRATLGKSDLQGSATLEMRKERPFLRARLVSNLFDFEETGVKQGVKEEVREKDARQEFLIPRDPWPTDGWDLLDADVELHMKQMRNIHPVPLDGLQLRAVMENQALRVDPLTLRLANGTISGRAALNASESPEEANLQLELRGLQLGRLIPSLEKQKAAALGRMNGHIELTGRGESPGRWLGNADGRILFAAERGQASALLVEVMGLDAAEAIMLIGKKRDQPLRCAVMNLAVKNGTATASPFVIDASDSVLSVEGSVDLGKETLDLKARAEPRDTSPFTLRTPVNITGTFLDPRVRPQAGPLAGRGAAAVALAAINPLLALIPFVDPGGDPEPGCQPQKR